MKPFKVRCINNCEYLEEGPDGHLHVIPIPNRGKLSELTVGKIYEVISIERDFYRIVDNTGEDYLFPKNMFV